MNYKLIMKISDLQDRIEDWKREMCTYWELRQAIIDVYKALEAEEKPAKVEKKPEEIE